MPAMTVLLVVIARSEATKQSQSKIATPPLREARNDKDATFPKMRCHARLRRARNDKRGKTATLPFGEPRNSNHPAVIARSEATKQFRFRNDRESLRKSWRPGFRKYPLSALLCPIWGGLLLLQISSGPRRVPLSEDKAERRSLFSPSSLL